MLVVLPLMLFLGINFFNTHELQVKKGHVTVGFLQKNSSFDIPAPPHPIGVETKEDVNISENDETFDSDTFTDYLASLSPKVTQHLKANPEGIHPYFALSKCKCPIYIRNCSFLI